MKKNFKVLQIGSFFLEEVKGTESQTYELYNLYEERKYKEKISAKANLPYQQHTQFVENHPYRYWFLVKHENKYIGSLYLTDMNSIGIYLKNDYLGHLEEIITLVIKRFDPLPYIHSVRRNKFHINIATNNSTYEIILKKMGAKLLQKTFVLPE